MSPNQGPSSGANTVTLTGTNLTGATAVTFGATAATSFTIVSATQITAVVPPGVAGAVNVTVTTPGGTSTAAIYTRIPHPPSDPDESQCCPENQQPANRCAPISGSDDVACRRRVRCPLAGWRKSVTSRDTRATRVTWGCSNLGGWESTICAVTGSVLLQRAGDTRKGQLRTRCPLGTLTQRAGLGVGPPDANLR
ncbi:IPT/TIG domain-containing protein [Nocardia gamkensis]|uniref:IPT/TIG domain-containing protein n=1 Tax=Nocardia gamkensis TaxID=352869 RepID=UPI001C3FEBCC